MAGDTVITVIGNLTGDPELRFTPSGAAVANFTVASTPRTFDRQSNEWKDGDTLFMRCSIWREAAENVAESLTKGTRVIVHGPARAAVVRDPRGREAHRRRAPGRRDRSVAALRLGQGHPRPALAVAAAAASPVAVAAGGGAAQRRRLRQRPVGDAGTGGRRRARPTSPRSDPHPDLASRSLQPRRPSGLQDRRSTTMAKPVVRKPKKKQNPLKIGQDRDGRLQGHRAAAQVHLRPRQDPRASGHRCLRPGAA